MLSESLFVHENYLAVLDLDGALALELAHGGDGLADRGDHVRQILVDDQAHVEGRAPMVGLSETVKQQCR